LQLLELFFKRGGIFAAQFGCFHGFLSWRNIKN
jgi:hypothetical protein